MPGQDNPHQNHRSRLRARFLRAGLSDFHAHNVLELLLFYAIPRRDTNPTAHALLSAFGTVDATIGADAATLCCVPGVGEGVARFFRAFREVTALAFGKATPRRRYPGADALGRHFCARLFGRDEGVAVTFLDNDFGLIGERVLDGVSIHAARFSPSDILKDALLFRAPMCALAHVHGDGLALPGGEDLDITRLLRSTLEAGGVKLLEHFIVSGERYTTLLYRYSGQGPIEESASEDGVDEKEKEALEALLAAAGLRQDAGVLLSAYGGLYRLATAPIGRHRREGLDTRLTALIALLSAVDTYCAAERPVPDAADEAALGRYLVGYFRAASEEGVLLLLFDGQGRHIATHTVGSGSVGEATVSCRHMAEGALFSGARQAVLAHNHPLGSCDPSEEDREATALLGESLAGLGIELFRHYIVAGEHYFYFK